MDTVLSEMGALLRAIPASTTASAEETGAWYERKARLFDHIAAEADTADEAARAVAVAAAARDHARRLRPRLRASSAA